MKLKFGERYISFICFLHECLKVYSKDTWTSLIYSDNIVYGVSQKYITPFTESVVKLSDVIGKICFDIKSMKREFCSLKTIYESNLFSKCYKEK